MQNFVKLNSNQELKSYFLGFLLSIILTLLPFFLVIQKFFSSEINYIVILLCAVIQIMVHFVCFLHLNFSLEKKWYLITLLFVLVIIFIVVFGSVWIMFNLNHHMMY